MWKKNWTHFLFHLHHYSIWEYTQNATLSPTISTCYQNHYLEQTLTAFGMLFPMKLVLVLDDDDVDEVHCWGLCGQTPQYWRPSNLILPCPSKTSEQILVYFGMLFPMKLVLVVGWRWHRWGVLLRLMREKLPILKTILNYRHVLPRRSYDFFPNQDKNI